MLAETFILKGLVFEEDFPNIVIDVFFLCIFVATFPNPKPFVLNTISTFQDLTTKKAKTMMNSGSEQHQIK